MKIGEKKKAKEKRFMKLLKLYGLLSFSKLYNGDWKLVESIVGRDKADKMKSLWSKEPFLRENLE